MASAVALSMLAFMWSYVAPFIVPVIGISVFSESLPMNTNMTGFKHLCILLPWTKVASVLEGLTSLMEGSRDLICV